MEQLTLQVLRRGVGGWGYRYDHVLHRPPGISFTDPLGIPGGSRALEARVGGIWGWQRTASSGPTPVAGETRRLYYTLRLPGNLIHVAVTVKYTCFRPKSRYDEALRMKEENQKKVTKESPEALFIKAWTQQLLPKLNHHGTTRVACCLEMWRPE